MSIDLKVYDNGDHTCLVWKPSDNQPVPNCRGFVISRVYNGQTNYLHGFTGFSPSDQPNMAALDKATALKFPIQRFLWWDYAVNPEDVVQYSILPVVGPNQNNLAFDQNNASPLTGKITITGQCSPHISAYFNKGIVAAQWVSSAVDQQPKGTTLANLITQPGNTLRNALSGLVRPQVLSLLAQTQKNNGKIFAALYELNDQELITALEAFGKNCNLILANGAFKSNNPPGNDENQKVRALLKGKINVFDRIVTTGHFAHNKIVIFCDAAGNPQSVLTGSLNWTSTGLCTQANNSLIINDPNVAGDYLAYWQRMKAAGNLYPASYKNANSTAKTYQVDNCSITPWCVPTSNTQDLDYARNLISAAKEGILFLFFNPGVFEPPTEPQKWTLLQNILTRHQPGAPDYDASLYIRGVVNQEIPELTEAAAAPANANKAGNVPAPALDPSQPAPVALYTGGNKPPQVFGHDVLVPANIKEKFNEFQQESLGAGVHVHSKVIVLDPFGANPVVMTGSHNLGFKASSANDDNLIIIEGNAALAAAYAVNIIAIFENYRWNSYVDAHRNDPKVWHGLVDNDQWQASYLAGDQLAEIEFWLGENGGNPPGWNIPQKTSAARPAKASTKGTKPVANSKRSKAKSKNSASVKHKPARKLPVKRKPNG